MANNRAGVARNLPVSRAVIHAFSTRRLQVLAVLLFIGYVAYRPIGTVSESVQLLDFGAVLVSLSLAMRTIRRPASSSK